MAENEKDEKVMNQDILAFLDYMEKEKGIPKNETLKALHSGLTSACRKALGTEVRIDIDNRSGKISAFKEMKVVAKVTNPLTEVEQSKARQTKLTAQLGETVEIEIPQKELGRIAAQVFKQSFSQNIRSIERTMIYDEFKDRVGEIVTGTVRRFEKSDVIVDLGKFEGVMPTRERVPTEEYTPGERVRALVLAVENNLRGPEIILTRSHPDFVRKLLQLEVSELHDGAVEIKALAREPGYRSKIAVWSNDEKIDPVGACVGIRGARVKNIVRELNNEKIDLFKWSANINELVIEALKPAKLKKIETDKTNKRVKVFVDEENLSLAIGRRGQNARLAAKITGWEIDVEKEKSEIIGFEQKLEHAVQMLSEALQLDHDTAQAIVTAGFASIDDLLEADEEDLKMQLPNFNPETIQKVRDNAKAAKETSQKA
jgi:N utilization substance protein A